MKKNKLQTQRKKLKLTRKELAEKLDISPVTVYKYETGERVPSDKVKVKLAELYGKTVGELFFKGK